MSWHKHLSHSLTKFVVIYFDNILIFNRCLFINKNNCSFIKSKANFLGIIISDWGVDAVHAKVQLSKIGLLLKLSLTYRVSVGWPSFIDVFIHDFSSIMALITKFLKVKSFIWTKAENKAFIEIKEMTGQVLLVRLLYFSKILR